METTGIWFDEGSTSKWVYFIMIYSKTNIFICYLFFGKIRNMETIIERFWSLMPIIENHDYR